MWLHTIRAYIRLGLFFYFKNVKVINAKNVPKSGAVLFLSNHQNALLDALLIAAKNGRFSYFLTRASVFKNPVISKILKSLLMLPVYRIRDGWNNLPKNNAIFSKSATLLKEENAMVIFPEGSHNIRRTVRPLSKGFTRIIFETFEYCPDLRLQLVPVGMNFVHAEKFGDSASIYFGCPISITLEDTKNVNKVTGALRQRIFDKLCQLTTHIDADHYDTILKKLEEVKVDFLDPESVNRCINSNFERCESSSSRDLSILKQCFKFFMILALIVPYIVWKWVVQPKIKEIEFTSTFRFAIAISLVPIYVLILAILLFFLVGLNWALLYFFGVLVLALLAIKL